MSTAQVELVGLWVAGLRLHGGHAGETLAIQQSHQFARDGRGDTALHRKQVRGLPLVDARPEHARVFRGRQPYGDTQSAWPGVNRPVDDGIDTELPAGLDRTCMRCGERVSRPAAGDLQALYMGERICDLVRQFDADIAVDALRFANVERQHQEPGHRRRGSLRTRACSVRRVDEQKYENEADAAD